LIPLKPDLDDDDSEPAPFYLNNPSEEISFLGHSQNYCICFVDMIDSTKITAQIADPEKIRKYYSIFINTMAAVARNFDAKIIKNTGDCLIYYFQKTSDSTNKSAFKDVLECGLTMIAASPIIDITLGKEGLPPIKYRISADYGRVEVAKSTSSQCDDLFGSTMNLCAKINARAAANGMVIGDDLYQIVKKSCFDDDYHFQGLGEYSIIDFKHKYPIYSVIGKNRDDNSLYPDTPVPKLELTQIHSCSTNQNVMGSVVADQERQKRCSHNVMLVDDEQDALLTYKKFLDTEGYYVEAFEDPEEALKCFASKSTPHYDLIVMDIRMPGLNGLQLYNRLKAINMSTKVLFVSALDVAEELISILPDVRYKDIIRKPVEQAHFVSTVRAALA
jgi:CheY-like chemotaxis protein